MLALLGPGPAHGELGERLGLLEADGRLAEELEEREEAGDDDERGVGVGHEAAERRHPLTAQPGTDDARLLAHADGWGVQVREADGRSLPGHHRPEPR